MKIKTPKQFDRDSLFNFFKQIDEVIDEREVTIDFSPLTFSKPTATLIVGSKLREWESYRENNSLRSYLEGISHSNPAHSYLMHIGFFDYIKAPIGKQIGEAAGNQNYLPITEISIPLFNLKSDKIENWHNLIQDESSKLAKILVNDHKNTEEIKTYSYCIRELIRNVFEHSGASKCYISGQRWANGEAEVVVVDSGEGILATLSEPFEIRTDREALDFALKPGVSRTSKMSQNQNTYDNSGFGLYVLSSISASFGWFVLGSGKSRVVGFRNTERIYQDFSFKGTFFGMRLLSTPKNFESVLRDIIEAGEIETTTMQGVTKRASTLSKQN